MKNSSQKKPSIKRRRNFYGVKIFLFILLFSAILLAPSLSLLKKDENVFAPKPYKPLRKVLAEKTIKQIPSPHPVSFEELGDFPIYSQSEFQNVEETSGCIGQNDSAVCGGATYTWSSPHDFVKIDDWYKNDKSKSGWRCSGGVSAFTDKRNAHLSTICTKLDNTFALDITATASATTLSVIIPHKTSGGISTAVISKSKKSPDGEYKISEELVGDSHSIQISDKTGKVISSDIISQNYETIGYGEKIKCQCKTSFKGWTDNSHFIISVENSVPEEYEYLVEAVSGNVLPDSLRKIR